MKHNLWFDSLGGYPSNMLECPETTPTLEIPIPHTVWVFPGQPLEPPSFRTARMWDDGDRHIIVDVVQTLGHAHEMPVIGQLRCHRYWWDQSYRRWCANPQNTFRTCIPSVMQAEVIEAVLISERDA